MRRSEKHLAEIEAELGPGERLVSWLPADDLASATSMVPTLSGALALTTRRLIFRGSSRKESVERELPLASARGFDVGWHRSAVDLRFDGNPEFGGFLARGVDVSTPFIAAVEEALAAPTSPAAERHAAPTVTDLAALSDLFERGLLTAEEFATAKSRLLG
jgi:hypothetical protein